MKTLFADDGEWRTSQVVFRRGRQRVVNQRRTALDQPAPRSLPWQTRTVLITQLGPGLQWAGSDPGPHGLDASWRAAEPTQPGEFLRWELFRQQLALSGDSAVHRRLRARLQVHARAVWRRQRDAWRTRVDPPRPDAPETVPAASHAGANTLGCWVSADGPVATEGVRYRAAPRRGHDCRADYRTDTTATDASRHRLTVEATLLLNGVAHELRLNLAVPLRRGTYALQACAEPASWSTLQLFDPWHNVSYCSQSQPRATVVLSHIDTLRRIVAGTFEGELQTNATPRQYVVLRQGRFDVRY
ncbi:hypothetical protein J7E24_15735 [Hymenobacter sp. ISL-91]|uniref:hypothetical protein n=1 Tax=Hymenobacter sp. ISL-91 TaxID=2819151 RepID=UPI001BE846C1|nr:hypothetical protein [Hymenobacter sp. ISL-91]MBT2559240.1 hypothetical protein [Hymenobacter sp. ISL-91]